jgi:MoxR-like ATPase
MSSGKITSTKIKRNTPMEQNVADIVCEIVPDFKVEVEDEEWQNADESIKEEISALDKEQKENKENISALTKKQKEDVEKIDSKITEIDKRLGDNQGNLSDELKAVKQEIENLKARKPLDVIVKIDKAEPKDLGIQHSQLPALIQILAAKLNVYIVGPAGAGKTTAAKNCADALGVDFYFTGAIASEFKLTGFIDAQGRIVSTQFREAFEKGGLFLFDEIDASYPQAVLAFNAALANDYMDFPDKKVYRHEKFYCAAAANTYGQGADRQYVGRNQLDAASLDRFVFLDWKYDEKLERALAGNEEWTDYVQRVRRFIDAMKIRHVVSPRASIYGAKLLAGGLPRATVEQVILWKGLDDASKNKVIQQLAPKEIQATREGKFIPKVKTGDTVKKDEVIGEIEYEGNGWGKNETETDEINSPYNGKIVFILESKEVENEEVIAKIESDDIIENKDD